MKRILLCFFIFIIVCFSIPIIFSLPPNKNTSTNANTGVNESVNVNTSINKQIEEKISEITYDYKKYNKIKLYHTKNKQIEEISIDEYLYGVVSAEMPANFEEEALKAQAVVARTYTLYKIINNKKKHENADICDNSKCCQAWIAKNDRLKKWKEKDREAYWNRIVKAVNSTQGKMITYKGKPINAFFHANSGGTTEPPINVWRWKRISLFASSDNSRRRCL